MGWLVGPGQQNPTMHESLITSHLPITAKTTKECICGDPGLEHTSNAVLAIFGWQSKNSKCVEISIWDRVKYLAWSEMPQKQDADSSPCQHHVGSPVLLGSRVGLLTSLHLSWCRVGSCKTFRDLCQIYHSGAGHA
jgi:hypothetical protein